jgi:hypothetical protein
LTPSPGRARPILRGRRGLAACLQREVAARDAHGGEGRIRAARFPARKTLEEFDFDHARGLKRDLILHLGTLDFVTAKENVIFLGPPGTELTLRMPFMRVDQTVSLGCQPLERLEGDRWSATVRSAMRA